MTAASRGDAGPGRSAGRARVVARREDDGAVGPVVYAGLAGADDDQGGHVHGSGVELGQAGHGELGRQELAPSARRLGMPVVMVRRPPLPDIPRCSAVPYAERWVLERTA